VTDANPTDRELEALKVLWGRSEATVREIADAMNSAGDDPLAYTTVLSLLQVMEQKGLVNHRRSGKAYVYVPRVERQSTFRRLAGSFLEKVFDGAVDEYLVHALDSKRLSSAELDQLEAMLANARRRPTKQPRKGGKK
jgi:BlaI family penicillinase repressor